LPKRGAFLVVDAIEHQGALEAQEIEEAHEKVVAIINELHTQAYL
jgi:hypothetical protein